MPRVILLVLIASAAFLSGAAVVGCISADPSQRVARIVLRGATFSGEE